MEAHRAAAPRGEASLRARPSRRRSCPSSSGSASHRRSHRPTRVSSPNTGDRRTLHPYTRRCSSRRPQMREMSHRACHRPPTAQSSCAETARPECCWRTRSLLACARRQRESWQRRRERRRRSSRCGDVGGDGSCERVAGPKLTPGRRPRQTQGRSTRGPTSAKSETRCSARRRWRTRPRRSRREKRWTRRWWSCRSCTRRQWLALRPQCH